MTERRDNAIGALLVIAAGVLWGTTGTAQALSAYASTPWALGAARLCVAAIIFLGIAPHRQLAAPHRQLAAPHRQLAAPHRQLVAPHRQLVAPRRYLAAPRRGAWPLATLPQGAWPLATLPQGAWPLAVLGAACVAAYQPAFFFGVRETGVAVGTLTAIGSAPLFAGLVGALTGAWPTRRWAAATAVVLAGLGLLLLPRGALRFDPAGVSAALAAGAAYAAYTWASARLLARGTPPVTMLAVLFTGAAAALATTAPAATAAWFTRPDRLAVVAYLGIVATVLPYLLWARGLKVTQPAAATTLSLTEPLTAALLGVLLLGEPATGYTLAGVALIFTGLLVTVWASGPAATGRTPRRGTTPRPRPGSAAASAQASDRPE